MLHKLRTLLNKNFWDGTTYAIREIALIVVGVLIAVWIDNWNEKRKDRILEIKTLRALQEGLRQDSLDIQNNIRGLNYAIKWREKVGKIAKKEMSYDSLSGFGSFGTTILFLNNVAPYESIKSLGLAKITNDTLRNQIISLYELEYKILMQTEDKINETLSENSQNYAERAFYLTSQKVGFDQVLYTFQKEKDFQFNNYIAMINSSYQLSFYQTLLPKVSQLIKNLDKECRR